MPSVEVRGSTRCLFGHRWEYYTGADDANLGPDSHWRHLRRITGKYCVRCDRDEQVPFWGSPVAPKEPADFFAPDANPIIPWVLYSRKEGRKERP